MVAIANSKFSLVVLSCRIGEQHLHYSLAAVKAFDALMDNFTRTREMITQIASAPDSSWCHRKRRQRLCIYLCCCCRIYVACTMTCASIVQTFKDAYQSHSRTNESTSCHRARKPNKLRRGNDNGVEAEAIVRVSAASCQSYLTLGSHRHKARNA